MMKYYRWRKIGLTFGAMALALTALLISSCSRTLERPTDSEYLIDAPATPASISVSVGDQTVQLQWNVVTSAVKYRVYRADTSASSFRVYDSTTAESFADLNVANNVTYFYRIASVSSGGLEGVQSPSVSARPGVFSVAVNDDREYTNSLSVTLSLTAPSQSSTVRLSNSPNLTDRPWVSFATTRNWELEAGDGVKTVYAEFSDPSGAISLGTVSDDIILDTRAVIDSVTENSGGEILSVGDKVLLTVAAGETDGKASVQIQNFNLACYDDGTNGDAVAGDGTYSHLWTVPSEADFVAETPVGRFTDRAGNKAADLAAQTLISAEQAPEQVTLFAFAESEARISLSWTQSDADDFGFYRVFRAEDAQVSDASTMVYSTSVQTVTSYIDTGLTSLTTYYYRVYVYDNSGLLAPSATVAVQTEENSAPEAVIVSTPDDLDDTSLRLSWSQSTEEDFASYRLYRAETDTRVGAVLVTIISNRNTTTYTDDNLDLATTSYYYWVTVYDRGGLSTDSDVASWVPSAELPVAVTVALPQAVDDTTSVRISWSASKIEYFDQYQVLRSETNNMSNAGVIAIVTNSSETEYVDGDGNFKETAFYYWVVVYDLIGQSAASASVLWDPN